MLNDLRVRERHTPRLRPWQRRQPGKTLHRYFLEVKWSQVQSCQPDRRNGVRTAIINSRVRHVGLMMRLLVTVGDHAGQLRAHELSLTDGQVVQGSVVSARNSVSRALLAATRKDLVADRGRVHREEGRRPAWSQHGDFSQTHRMRTCAKRARCTRRRRHPVRWWRVRPRCGERGPAQCVINCPP
jgi:hypothetical protein